MWAVGIAVCPFVLVGALSLPLWSRRPHQVLPVCILDYTLKGEFAGSVVVCPFVIPSVQTSSSVAGGGHCSMFRYPFGQALLVFIPSVRPFRYPLQYVPLSLRSGPFGIYPFGRGPFRLGCTQTCLLHICICWPRSFLLYGLFVFVSAAFATENF